MSKNVSAAQIALLLSKLSGAEVSEIVRALAIPRANFDAWLAGNRSALRLQSVAQLMSMLGLRLADGKWSLDSTRVHFWHLTVPVMGSIDDALAPLMCLSKWLEGTSITRVEDGQRLRAWSPRRNEVWLLGSPKVRLVVTVRRPAHRSVRVTPDVVRGALWRDDTRSHTIRIEPRVMAQLRSRDLTAAEFDRVFNGDGSDRVMSAADLALAIRQYNLTPDDVMAWVRERYEPADARSPAEDLDASGEVIARGVRMVRRAAG